MCVNCLISLCSVFLGFAKLLHNIWLSSSNSPSSNPLKWVLNKNTNVNHFPVISPQLLKSCVNKHLDFFCDYFQHDAQEFMRFFVSGLHEGFKKNSTFVPPPNTEGLRCVCEVMYLHVQRIIEGLYICMCTCAYIVCSNFCFVCMCS